MIGNLATKVAGLGAALALFTQVAAAQEWQGPYLGAILGYGEGPSNHINGTAERNAPDIFGSAYGVTVGHNFSAPGNLVLGVEFDAASLGLEGAVPSGPGFGCSLTLCRTEVSWLATLRGRVGIANGQTLFFGTAGVAVGGVEATIDGEAYLEEGVQAANGWTAGVGVEHKVSDRVSLKGEVLYTDLGQTRYDDQSSEPGFYVDVAFTQVRLGLNFGF